MTRSGGGDGGGLAWYHVAGGILLALALLTTAWLGFGDVLEEYPSAATAGQKAAMVTEALYAMFATLAVVGIAARRAWTRFALYGWTVAVAATALLASIFWGGTSIAIGAIGGGVALAIGWVLLWLGWRAVAARVEAGPNGSDG